MIFLLSIFTVLLLHKGRSQYSNILLAVYLISQIIGLADGVLFSSVLDFSVWHYVLSPIIFLWLPLYFFYLKSLLNQRFRFSFQHFFHFIPYFFALVYFINHAFGLSANNLSFTDVDSYFNPLSNSFFFFVFLMQVISYNLVILREYRNTIRNSKVVINKLTANWIKTAIFGFLIACIIVQLGIFTSKLNLLVRVNWYLIGNITFLIFFVILFYKTIINPSILSTRINNKHSQFTLDVTNAENIIQTLDKYMKEKRLYCSPNLSLKQLAETTGIPERNISQVINEYKSQNFFDYINNYRVEFAMELLKDKNNASRTMLDIMFEAGFNSKSTFNSAFKKIAGYTPSAFKKLNK